MLGDAGMSDAPAAFGVAFQARIAFVGAQRIAAGGDEIDDALELLPWQLAIGPGPGDLGVEFDGIEGRGAGSAEDVLGQHVIASRDRVFAVLVALVHGFQRRLAFEHFEAVGGDQQRLARLVQPVVGTADALQHARRALWGADLYDEIDIAPVDAEVERRGADHGAQCSRDHGAFDLTALFDRERAVMQRDRQPIVVDRPEPVEQHLGLAAGVDEQQRGAVLLDDLVKRRHGVGGGMSGPGDAIVGGEDFEFGLGAAAGGQQVRRSLWHWQRDPVAQQVRPRDRGAERRDAQSRRDSGKTRNGEREQFAALAGDQCMQFVKDDAAERAEQPGVVGVAEQQGDLLWRGKQDMRRIVALALAPSRGRIAGAGLYLDLELHFGNGVDQVAGDVDGQGLERRNVQRVQPVHRMRDQILQRRQEAGQGLARAGGGDQQCRCAGVPAVEHIELVLSHAPALGREPGGNDRGERHVSTLEDNTKTANVNWEDQAMTGPMQQDNVVQRLLALTPEAALALLAREVQGLPMDSERRIAVGLTGGPGVGKSTLAAQLVAALNARNPGRAALVPMDGFHMRHTKLEALGIDRDKGAPHTFEGAEFVAFLARLKAATEPISGPGYSRKIEDVVDDVFTVQPETKILVVEGNYLLLNEAPWDAVKRLLDLAVFIDVPREKVRARLLRRHAEEGLFSEERNRQHIERVDLANYDRVTLSRPHADLVIELVTEA